jgi:diadenylate cyclase
MEDENQGKKDVKEVQVKLVEEKKDIRKEELTEILKVLSPGTFFRNAVEGIQKAKVGGLIVAYNEAMQQLFEGGFKINTRATAQRLIELSKMDGAIILSRDLRKILYANVLLTPNHSILSNETGTRHKAAERIAKQAETMVIAVSQRRDEIALFYKSLKYVIKDTSDIIRRSTEVLQILEKHREVFERNKRELDEEEFLKRPKIIKALLLIQRGIMILKISETLRGYIIELGIEGAIVKSRLKELLHRVEREVDEVIHDYTRLGFSKSKKILSILTYDELLDLENIRQCLGLSGDSEIAIPKGHRILEKLGIDEKDTGVLIKNFKHLPEILTLKKEDLIPFFDESRTAEIFEKINHERES